MSEEGHGRRYSRDEKKNILLYLEDHTYKETSERFSISETTLARWRKSLSQSVSDIKAKIVIGINQYWLDYLNENITNGVWENYDDAFLKIIRFYDKNYKEERELISEEDFSSNIKNKIDEFLTQNLEIHSIIAIKNDIIKFKLKSWPSDEIEPLMNQWMKLKDAKGTFNVLFNGSKYILQASKDQALYINVDNRKALQFYASPEDINKGRYYSKQDFEIIEEMINNDTFQREYICGIKVDYFTDPWYFFAIIHKEKMIPTHIIQDFYKTIRNYISNLKNKKRE